MVSKWLSREQVNYEVVLFHCWIWNHLFCPDHANLNLQVLLVRLQVAQRIVFLQENSPKAANVK